MSEVERYIYKVVKPAMQNLGNGQFREYTKNQLLYNLFYYVSTYPAVKPGDKLWACEDEHRFFIVVEYIGTESGKVLMRKKQKPIGKITKQAAQKFIACANQFKKLSEPNLAEMLSIIGISKIRRTIVKFFPREAEQL